MNRLQLLLTILIMLLLVLGSDISAYALGSGVGAPSPDIRSKGGPEGSPAHSLKTSVCSEDPAKHPLYCAIEELNPYLDREWTMSLSNAIHRGLRNYPEVDVALLLAIGMQESSLRPVHRLDNRGQITDIGVFQIHVQTAQNYHLNIVRLLVDLDYQVESAIRILVNKRQVCRRKGVQMPWSCYHSFTPSRRDDYAQRVLRYYLGDSND